MVRNLFDPGYYGFQELRAFGFAAVGENLRVSRDCTIIGPERIAFGDHVRIDSGATIIATGGTVTFAGLNHVGGQCHLSAAADLSFGEFSGTSQGVRIYTATDDISGRQSGKPTDRPGMRIRPIEIAAYVSIGSGSVILPGCHIREGSVVGALSLVNRPLRSWGIYHGDPVKRINECPRNIDNLLFAVRKRLSA